VQAVQYIYSALASKTTEQQDAFRPMVETVAVQALVLTVRVVVRVAVF
jgi:hypothetical protein